ncbi:MAG: acyltransferase family protein [Acidobacteriota bacterium]
MSANPTRRLHDLDALRAFAMLLGIGLHGALSFVPFLWPIQDGHQNQLFGLVIAAVHGFRMPVFFLLSGFFTAMLWRRRGLRALLAHRARRIALPLLLGVVTLVPAIDWLAQRGLELGPGEPPPAADADPVKTVKTVPGTSDSDDVTPLDTESLDPATGLTPLSRATVAGDAATIRRLIDAGAAIDGANRDGSTPLLLAAVFGQSDAAEALLAAGADVDAQNRDGSTPLHTAAFFGHVDVVEQLLAAGADPSLVNGYGQTPAQVLSVDWATTQLFARAVGLELDEETVVASRQEIAELLGDPGAAAIAEGVESGTGLLFRLMHEPFFHHLWFLWFLIWLVAAFGVYAWLADRFGWRPAPRVWSLSRLRLLWLVPITAIPQAFMGRLTPVFGADTSAGLMPMPQVLAYYAVFFAFGAIYFDARDDEERVGRWWLLTLPVGLFLLFPVGIGLTFAGAAASEPLLRTLSVLVQATYPWVVSFGLIGLFRRLLRRERRGIRYLSDASYWLYLAHLPLIMGAQILVRNWQLPATIKFVVICSGVTALLLVVYQLGVRYTWLGRMLNGPRERTPRAGRPRLEPSGAVD